MRDAGTYDVTVVAHAGTEDGAKHLIDRFAWRSRLQGTVVYVKTGYEQASRHDWVVTINYRHTCHNKGNSQSDAKRFLAYATRQKNGATYRYTSVVIRVRPWKELVTA